MFYVIFLGEALLFKEVNICTCCLKMATTIHAALSIKGP